MTFPGDGGGLPNEYRAGRHRRDADDHQTTMLPRVGSPQFGAGTAMPQAGGSMPPSVGTVPPVPTGFAPPQQDGWTPIGTPQAGQPPLVFGSGPLHPAPAGTAGGGRRSVKFALVAVVLAIIDCLLVLVPYGVVMSDSPLTFPLLLVAGVAYSMPFLLVAVVIGASADAKANPRVKAFGFAAGAVGAQLLWILFSAVVSTIEYPAPHYESAVMPEGVRIAIDYLFIVATMSLIAASWIVGHNRRALALAIAPVCGGLIAGAQYWYWQVSSWPWSTLHNFDLARVLVHLVITAIAIAIFVACMWLARAISR